MRQISTIAAKFNPGALAIIELIRIRCEVQGNSNLFTSADGPDDACIFHMNMSSAVERGLPQFNNDLNAKPDPDENRACVAVHLHSLTEDLLKHGHMTEDRADAINMAFENVTGHEPMIEIETDPKPNKT